jgi:hypothetical protein
MCDDRMPTENGRYRVRHTSFANGGNGVMHFDTNVGWLIPDSIKSFYHVTGWFDDRFREVTCSQCGCEFGPGDSGYSHCVDHRLKVPTS